MGAAAFTLAEATARAGLDFDVDMLLDSALVAGRQLRTNHHDRRTRGRGKCKKNQSYGGAGVKINLLACGGESGRIRKCE